MALARRLEQAGVRWTPRPGDRFVVADRDMDDDVFVVSDMTIDVQRRADGAEVIAFNGTVEWAMDSVYPQDALWLPSEAQLRELLGGTFRRLERDGSHWRILLEMNGEVTTVQHAEPAEAYGLALLRLITGEDPG